MAVDFPTLFSRNQIKTEDFGWSLMDVGVSSVMVASAMGNRLILGHKSTQKRIALFTDLKNVLVSNVLVLIAASIRFTLLTSIDYHDHVTEWGVHWNFFVTIAIVNFFLVFIRKPDYVLILAILICFSMELLISHYDIPNYIFFAPRTDFISANKEGILSLPGYFILSLIGIWIGDNMYKTLIFDEPLHL